MKYLLWILLLIPSYSLAQEVAERKGALKAGIGLGYNEGDKESGLGLVYTIGWQKAIDSRERLRINPNILFGGFTPLMMTDKRDQYIRSGSFGCHLYYDMLKGKHLSLFAMVGAYGNYTRGLLGDGEFNTGSEYYHKFYAGGTASLGIRVYNPSKRIGYEIRPLTFQYGSNQHFMGYVMVSIDFEIRR
ncbi:hypothetical protein KEM09_19905 [Carboxylicivirga mesophila]|uniref:Outer membrane protein beta-barrel domain-containing protein n=1 Tax=Carboxylicivirga mesophila TaxID=1166478 RepID=A0ABS5KF49_9BACT|nr:hypothetical protein [Carboxylicivirga mesophila]MBS2213684.1 hypothetical protein [Carboxylicivirga mesophila]